MVSEGLKSEWAQKFSSNCNSWTAERNGSYLSVLSASGQWHFLTGHPHWTSSQSQWVSSIPWCLSVEKLNMLLVKVVNVVRKLEVVGNTQVLSNIWDASGHLVHLHKAVKITQAFSSVSHQRSSFRMHYVGYDRSSQMAFNTHEQATVYLLCLGTHSGRPLHFDVVALSYVLPLVSCI